MTKESMELETYVIQPIAKGAKPANLEEFLIGKLGNSAGRSLYKDLVSAVKDCSKSQLGDPAIDLTTKRGNFVVLQAAS